MDVRDRRSTLRNAKQTVGFALEQLVTIQLPEQTPVDAAGSYTMGRR